MDLAQCCCSGILMNYSETAALHAFMLLLTHRYGDYDLDIYGTFAILSSVSLTTLPALAYAKSLRNSPYRPLIAIWGSFAALGGYISLINISLAEVFDGPNDKFHSRLKNRNATTSGGALGPYRVDNALPLDPCLKHQATLRGKTEGLTVDSDLLYYPTVMLWSYFLFGLIGGPLGLLAFVLAPIRKRTRCELNDIVNEHVNTEMLGSLSETQVRLKKEEAQAELRTGQATPDDLFWFSYVWMSLVAATIVLNELRMIFKNPLPASEKPYAVGQWAPMATIVLSLIAAAVNEYSTPKWQELQKIYEEDRLALLKEQEAGHAPV